MVRYLHTGAWTVEVTTMIATARTGGAGWKSRGRKKGREEVEATIVRDSGSLRRSQPLGGCDPPQTSQLFSLVGQAALGRTPTRTPIQLRLSSAGRQINYPNTNSSASTMKRRSGSPPTQVQPDRPTYRDTATKVPQDASKLLASDSTQARAKVHTHTVHTHLCNTPYLSLIL